MRICTCSADEEVRFQRDDGLTIAASIYSDPSHLPKPGIVLVHGNTHLGRRLSLYKVLASELAERGYLVLTIDMTGYGESDDPFEPGVLEAIDNERDVVSALDYMTTVPEVDEEKIYAVGHSMGATPALAAGIKEPAVRKIVAIGPARRLTERLSRPSDRDYFWQRAKHIRTQVYGSPFPEWFGFDAWLEWSLSLDISGFLTQLSAPAHKPILLIDGELEAEADKRYLRDLYERLSEPKHYVTIRGSDHYANTRDVGRLVLYDEHVVSETVSVIDDWLRR